MMKNRGAAVLQKWQFTVKQQHKKVLKCLKKNITVLDKKKTQYSWDKKIRGSRNSGEAWLPIWFVVFPSWPLLHNRPITFSWLLPCDTVIKMQKYCTYNTENNWKHSVTFPPTSWVPWTISLKTPKGSIQCQSLFLFPKY